MDTEMIKVLFEQLTLVTSQLGLEVKELIPYGVTAIRAQLADSIFNLAASLPLFLLSLFGLCKSIERENEGLILTSAIFTATFLAWFVVALACSIGNYTELKYAPEYYGAKKILNIVDLSKE